MPCDIHPLKWQRMMNNFFMDEQKTGGSRNEVLQNDAKNMMN